MEPARKIDVVFLDAGSGHRSAANAVKSALSKLQPGWQIRLVNLTEAVAFNRFLAPIVRHGIDLFNWQLVREQIPDFKRHVELSFFWRDRWNIQATRKFWQQSSLDMVVSVTPIYNPVLYESARLANPDVVCVTIPVDFEEVLPGYWFTPHIVQDYILSTQALASQARLAGIAADRLHRIDGMIIDPEFYAATTENKHNALSSLGLDPALPTGVVSFGGQGHQASRQIALELCKLSDRVNVIYLCGHNANLLQYLTKLSTPYKKLVLGYQPNTPVRYLKLADFVIGKPGAMTIHEALATQTPIIVLKSKGLAAVQRPNEKWLADTGIGLVVDSVAELPTAIRSLLGSDTYKQNAARAYHQGIFQAAKYLKQQLLQ